ncbi:unnamed protein product [Cuscuta campestris]|uniref:DNA polymerase eta n=1 Tax=Cuscuta campestris TaxID=132261 RepID=A0A484L9Y8_9ASTE|nr:unnamed protein product [Cuscuta campestris]
MILFQAGLREFLGTFNVMTPTKQHDVWGVTSLSVSASKIICIPSGTPSILNYFQSQSQACSSTKQLSRSSTQDAVLLSPIEPVIERSQGTECATPALEIHEDCGEPCTIKGVLSSSYPLEDGFREETFASPISEAGTPSKVASNQAMSMLDPGLEQITSSLTSIEQDTKSSKNKVTSILAYFHGEASCSLPEVRRGSSPFTQCGSSTQGSSIVNATGQTHQKQTTSFYYNINDIDPSVVNELPQEIQDEVRAWLRPQKQANIAKKGSDITRYFSPAK